MLHYAAFLILLAQLAFGGLAIPTADQHTGAATYGGGSSSQPAPGGF